MVSHCIWDGREEVKHDVFTEVINSVSTPNSIETCINGFGEPPVNNIVNNLKNDR